MPLKSLYRSRFGSRLSNIERLEDRIVLSVSLPTVSSISLASTEWSTAFYDHIGSDGYTIPVGSSEQEDTLSWNNLDQVRIEFSEDVYVNSEDLSISGINNVDYGILDFSYTPEDATAVWTLSSPLEVDRLMLDLDADGVDPITDLDGNLLDGEWVNSSSTTSGNGTAGGDFEFLFNVLPGDTLDIDLLNFNNLLTIYNHVGENTTDPTYEASSDVDGDGMIETSDWQEVQNNLLETLPTGDPEGVSNDAPTSTGFDAVEITDDAIDHAISLYSVFEDAEDTDAQLTYSVVSNDDPSLFDSVSINSTTGELILNTASNESGRANLIIKATDQDGLSVESNLIIDVDRQNNAPVVLSATTTDLGSNRWFVEGWAEDLDNLVEDLFIVLDFEMFEQRVSISSSGYFYFEFVLDPNQEESIDIYIADDGTGAQSNSINVEVG